MDVRAEVTVYEHDQSETWGDSDERIILRSHWNDPDAVEIEMAGRRFVVMIEQMQAALRAVRK